MAETVGLQLKNARTERGLTIDQAARLLHIRPKYIEALEEDRRKELPSPVHAKGFLRMYADLLGLPQQPLLDSWEGKLPAVILPPPELPPDPIVDSVVPSEPESAPLQVEELEQTASLASTPLITQKSDEPLPPIPLATDTNLKPSLTSQTSFVQIGKQLARQRVALGLSLAEVERYTHVRAHYLQALEDGQIERLPSPVQGRGMLSNYARFLNLNGDALLLQFAEGLQSNRVERLETNQKGKPKSQPVRQVNPPKAGPRRLFSRDLLISGLLITIIVAFALWTAAQVDALNQRQETTQPPSIAEVLLSKPSNTPVVSGTPTAQAILSTLAPNEVQSGQSGQSAQIATTLTVPANGTAPLQVYVIARIRAFLRVTVDGKVAFEGRIVPGNDYLYSGDKKIELLTGSAAAIQVYFNQKDLGALGLVGQVKSLVFTKEGAVTPTSPYTATPTRTVQPVSTYKPSPTLPTATITPLVP